MAYSQRSQKNNLKLFNLFLEAEEKNRIKHDLIEDDFLTWSKRVSPHFNFNYAWIKKADEVQQKNKFVLLAAPPQHGKSTAFTIHKAAYLLTKYPEEPGIVISYNTNITARFHREILQLLEKEKVPLYSKAQNEIVHKNLRGTISFCGFESGITSKPASWILIDDPIRSAKDAYSQTFQETLWSGFTTSIIPRLQENFRALFITHTRWHDNDLIGQILSKGSDLKSKFSYVYVNFPALCDSSDDILGRKIGDPLCPERFSAETIKEKMLLAQGDGYALYQGSPKAPDGNIFKETDVQWFYGIDFVPKNCLRILSVDATFKDGAKNDNVCVLDAFYCLNSKKYYIVDVFLRKADFTTTIDIIKQKQSSAYYDYCLIEDKANGPAIINTLEKFFTNLQAVNPEGGKISRAYAASPAFKTKSVLFNSYAAQIEDLKSDLVSFPNGKHDDGTDALTQMINFVSNEIDPIDYRNVSYTGIF